MSTTVDCKKECVNGCLLGDECPNKDHQEATSKFIGETSLDKMLEMAEAARLKKITEPPKWIIPDDF